MKNFMKALGIILWITGLICGFLCLNEDSDLAEFLMWITDIEPMTVMLVVWAAFFLFGLPFFCIGLVCDRQEELDERLTALKQQLPMNTPTRTYTPNVTSSAPPVRPHNPDPTVNTGAYGNPPPYGNSAPYGSSGSYRTPQPGPDPYSSANPYRTANPRAYSPDAVDTARSAGRSPQERAEQNEMDALNRQFKQRR